MGVRQLVTALLVEPLSSQSLAVRRSQRSVETAVVKVQRKPTTKGLETVRAMAVVVPAVRMPTMARQVRASL